MITIKNTQRKIKINQNWLRKVAGSMIKKAGYPDFDLGIWLTTNKTIRSYNKKYRKKDKPTDILSFPYHPELKPGTSIIVHDPDDKNLGDIIISLEYVVRDAPKTWGRTFDEHMVALVAHGIAHLLGHDHMTTKQGAKMLDFEQKLRKNR